MVSLRRNKNQKLAEMESLEEEARTILEALKSEELNISWESSLGVLQDYVVLRINGKWKAQIKCDPLDTLPERMQITLNRCIKECIIEENRKEFINSLVNKSWDFES